MTKSSEHAAKGNAERVRRYRHGLRTDLREISAQLTDLRDLISALKPTCQAPQPKQPTDQTPEVRTA